MVPILKVETIWERKTSLEAEPPTSLCRVCSPHTSVPSPPSLLAWLAVGPVRGPVLWACWVGAPLGPACAWWLGPCWALPALVSGPGRGPCWDAFLWVLDTSNGVGCSHLAFISIYQFLSTVTGTEGGRAVGVFSVWDVMDFSPAARRLVPRWFFY
jgi:hypothetical protein